MVPTLRELGIDRFDPVDQLKLIGDIWDSLGRTDEIPESHCVELDRRLADADALPGDSAPWEEVLERLRSGR